MSYWRDFNKKLPKIIGVILLITSLSIGLNLLVTEEVIADKTLNEIWEILLNIPFDYNNVYGDLKYQKLRDIKSLNSSSFRSFLTAFTNKSANFSPNRYSNRSFPLANQTFYWVPLKDFPGNE